MRKEFAEKIIELSSREANLIFLTGDLGYMALEKVQSTLGDKFINMGVAEQNMVSAAAGMAHEGFKVIAYSIAPFVVYRPHEQIRNDVCFHNKSVFIVGNGGGYGYGIMGSSHHCIEDIAVLSCLPNMTCYVPSFVEDLYNCMEAMFQNATPAYLRLGLGKSNPYNSDSKTFFTQLLNNSDSKITIVASGPVINNVVEALKSLEIENNVDLFNLCKYPIVELTEEFKKSLIKTSKLICIEEHVSIGGLGQQIAIQLLKNNINLQKFDSLCALGYPNGLYGNQQYHQKQSGLDTENIKKILTDF